jgi:hypothetical protein
VWEVIQQGVASGEHSILWEVFWKIWGLASVCMRGFMGRDVLGFVSFTIPEWKFQTSVIKDKGSLLTTGML